MQLSILPVKEYNVSNDAKEKEASSSSFLDCLQEKQAESEKKQDAASTNVTLPAAYPIAIPMNMEQPSSDAKMNSNDNEFSLHSPMEESSALHLQGQALKPHTDVAEMVQHIGNVSQAVTTNPTLPQAIGMDAQKSGTMNIVTDNQGILSKVQSEPNTGKMETLLTNLQQAGNVSQAVATNQMLSQAMGIKVQTSGPLDMVMNNQSMTDKVQSEPNIGKIKTVLNNQMVQQAGNVSQAVATNPTLSQATGMNVQESGMMNVVMNNQGMIERVQSGPTTGNTESLNNSNNPMVDPMPSPAARIDDTNLLKVLMQCAKNESKRTDNKGMTIDSNPMQDKHGPSNDSAAGGILSVNLQAPKSVEVHTAASAQATVDKLSQDITSTFSPRIHVTGTPEKMEATLSLTPEHLGTVDVKIVIQDGQVSARLIADSSLGRATLEQHVDSLYAALQQQGLQVDTIHISQHQSSFSSAFSQGGDSAPKQGQQQAKRRGENYSDKEEYSDSLYESEWVSQINTIA